MECTPPAASGSGAHRVLGVPITVVTLDGLLKAIERVVFTREATVFVGLYASLYRALARDSQYKALVARSITYPDGQGVVAELHRRGAQEAVRLATTDVVHPIVRLAAGRGWRVGLYGAAPGVAERAATALRSANQDLDIRVVADGYGDGPAPEHLRSLHLDVLFVALGAGRQERWAAEVGVAAVPAVLTCGGLLDFLAGDKRRAPGWVQRSGLEWVFRILLEPRRLFTRYLLGNSYFLWHARRERRSGVAAPAGEQ